MNLNRTLLIDPLYLVTFLKTWRDCAGVVLSSLSDAGAAAKGDGCRIAAGVCTTSVRWSAMVDRLLVTMTFTPRGTSSSKMAAFPVTLRQLPSCFVIIRAPPR